MSNKTDSPNSLELDESQYMLGVIKGMQNFSLFTLVMKGDAMEGLGRNLHSKLVAAMLPEAQNPELVNLCIQIKKRFECLMCEGKTATHALDQMCEEGLLERYEQLTNPNQEIH